MSKLNFGIWGCGMVSKSHVSAINNIEDANLYGFFDLNKEAMENAAKANNAKTYECLEDFLGDENIDVITICLPSGLHYETALACLKAGKHVLVEKPLTLDVETADELIAESERTGKYVGVISQLRYSNAIKDMIEIIESGALGTITLANVSMKYYRSPEYYSGSSWRGTFKMDGGGALMNQGIHGIDLLQYLMGKVKSVSANMKTLVHNIEVEDTLVAILDFENGAIGTVQATTSVYPGYERRIEICGNKGSVTLKEDRIEICDIEGGAKYLNKETKRVYETGKRPEDMDSSLHEAQIRDYIKSIQKGETPDLDAKEGRKSVDIITSIYKSAKTGEKVFL